ncbi:MAG: hypothetical protein Tp1111DCM1112741_49 [Prokaryotic dsDNA virus sp.]|nr:MAG: hypothetical protein Tp1111DCM1112741_49 [Prokaryotic dsDNA virus sp.]|tara:strand:- start:5769 stop:6983 length:1215 start_codon:yes stop_codon:yes gene_type:complete
MATQKELIALFGSDFKDVLDGLAKLPPEARELLDQTMNKMLFDANIFESRVNKTIATQSAAGMSTAAITAGLANDMANGGAIFGEIRNTIKESLVEGINNSGRAGAFEAYDVNDKTLFTWITVAGHRICADCAPRGGQMQTLKDWEGAGLPATGWSVCGGYCYCILDPSGKISPRIQMQRTMERQRRPDVFMPLNGVEAAPLADKAIRKAKIYVDETDSIFKKLATKNGGKMEGLAYHLKSRDSLIRKIVTESMENKYSARDVLIQNVKDALRYTMLVDDATYVKATLGTIDDLKDLGWKSFKVKNTWGPDSGYKGINTAWANPYGQYVELQFHTPVSFKVKMDQAHKIYEEYRLVGTTKARKKQLDNQLVNIYKSVPEPAGWNQINELNTFKQYLENLGIELI